jgi:hypothetical protein
VTGTCVVDPGDRIIYHSSAVTAAEQKPDSWHLLGGGAKAFFDKAQATTMAESIPVMTYAIWGGNVYLLAAAPITPERPTPAQSVPHRRPLLVLYKALSREVGQRLGTSFLLNDLKVQNGAVVPASMPWVRLGDHADQAIVYLTWTPSRPGDQLFSELLPRLSIAVCVQLIARWWCSSAGRVRRARRAMPSPASSPR